MIRHFLTVVMLLGVWCGVNLYATSEATFVAGVENTYPNTSEENIGAFSDIIFSLTGSGLTLDTSDGQWNAFSAGIVNQTGNGTPAGNPFFDNKSLNGTDENIGFCLTTSNCGSSTETAGASLNEYLSDTGNTAIPAPDFYFTGSGTVTFSLLASLGGSNNSTESVGIYDTTGSNTVTWVILDDVLQDGGVVSVPESGTFGLIFKVGTDTYFYSQNSLYGFDNGTRDLPADSRYALFSEAEGVPEPATMALFGIGALALGMVGRLRRRRS
jgi:hypothetical protein